MAMIDIKDLKKSFGNNHVLHGVNLSVDRGDIVAIIGSSGSGKSTLVRCIAGLEKPDTGQILLNGEEYLDDGKGVGKIGMVFQNFNLFPHYTARENITKPLTIVKKMEASAADEIAEKLLRKVKLENAANQFPADRSSGLRSQDPWLWNRKSSCSMNPHRPWTHPLLTKSSRPSKSWRQRAKRC